MPQTVPNRPMNGAVLPIEASSTWPNCSCASTAVQRVAQAPRQLRVGWPSASSVPAGGRRGRGVEQRQQHRFAVEARRAARAPRPGRARPRTPAPRARCRGGTRRSSQPFQKITTQALTDIAAAAARPRAGDGVALLPERAAGRPSRQAAQRRRCASAEAEHVVHAEQAACRWPARKRAARRLPCGVGGAAASSCG